MNIHKDRTWQVVTKFFVVENSPAAHTIVASDTFEEFVKTILEFKKTNDSICSAHYGDLYTVTGKNGPMFLTFSLFFE